MTQATPGGDAADPHLAALTELLNAPWGERNDKDDQLRAPTPDWERWKRVRFFGVQHLTGFRYGNDHHAMAVVFVQPAGGQPVDSRSCLRRFEAWGFTRVQHYDVKLSPMRTRRREYRGEPMWVKSVDGYVDFGASREHFSGAFAGYPNLYEDACLIYAVALPWRGHEQLAKRVRDRWVLEGFQRLRALTEHTPTRR